MPTHTLLLHIIVNLYVCLIALMIKYFNMVFRVIVCGGLFIFFSKLVTYYNYEFRSFLNIILYG